MTALPGVTMTRFRWLGKTNARRVNGRNLEHGQEFEVPAVDADYFMSLPDVEFIGGAGGVVPSPLSEEPTPAAGRNPTTDRQE